MNTDPKYQYSLNGYEYELLLSLKGFRVVFLAN
jgi:hypothetical protein